MNFLHVLRHEYLMGYFSNLAGTSYRHRRVLAFGRLLGSAIVVGAAFGCDSSTTSISLTGDRTLEIDAPRQLMGAGSLCVASTKDGSKIVVLPNIHQLLKPSNQLSFEIQDWSGKTLSTLSLDSFPLMFAADGRHLFCVNTKALVSHDLDTGIQTNIGPADFFPEARNLDHTIVTDGNILLTATGMLVDHTSRVSFDQYGNAWFVKDGRWMKLTPAGKMTNETVPPAYRVADQSHDRGPMHLVETKQKIYHQGAEARLSCIWVEDDRSPIPPQKAETGYPNRSAMVYAGADVTAYGFMPGHDEIYVATQRGTFFVPYRGGREGLPR